MMRDCEEALHEKFFSAGERQSFRVKKKNMPMCKKKRLLFLGGWFLDHVAIARVRFFFKKKIVQ